MKVAFANERGGAARTACALLLTLGLVELGRKVTYAELRFGDEPSPAFPADGLTFDYKPIAVRSIDHLFALHGLNADTLPSSDLVLDLTAVFLTSSWCNAELLDRAEIFLVPFRRGQADIAAAAQTWHRLRTLADESSSTDGRIGCCRSAGPMPPRQRAPRRPTSRLLIYRGMNTRRCCPGRCRA